MASPMHETRTQTHLLIYSSRVNNVQAERQHSLAQENVLGTEWEDQALLITCTNLGQVP